MTLFTLIHPEVTVTVPIVQAKVKCTLFERNPTLLTSPYRVQSPVTPVIFREFVTELEGNAVTITDTNFRGLQELCNELGFSDLTARLWVFHPSIGSKEAEDAEARGRIAALEDEMEQHGHEIAFSQDELRQLATDFRRLPGEVSRLRSEVSDLKTQIATGFAQTNFFGDVTVTYTLTVILDTKGNIFGAFTALEWEFCQAKSLFGEEFSLPSEESAEHPGRGPHFGSGFDIHVNVSDNCNANTASSK
jgi:hypothetical protein